MLIGSLLRISIVFIQFHRLNPNLALLVGVVFFLQSLRVFDENLLMARVQYQFSKGAKARYENNSDGVRKRSPICKTQFA